MNNDLMLGGLYILMAGTLVFGSLIARREPAAKLLTMALAWMAIFGAGFILFTFRDNLGWVAQRLKAEAVGSPVQQGTRNPDPNGYRRAFLGRCEGQWPRRQVPGR